MNKQPAITVFMPVYNAKKYLKEAIDSILNQTFFYPYPENLINITDSGKGRKL